MGKKHQRKRKGDKGTKKIKKRKKGSEGPRYELNHLPLNFLY
jgi:hypothetical protein